MAVVSSIIKGRAQLCIFGSYDIKLTAQHIPGVNNAAADHLSCNNLPQFFSISPQAKRVPTPIPQELMDLVTAVAPDWTSMTFKKTGQYYQYGQKRYLKFCTEAHCDALPTSENILLLFASHLPKEGLSHQTIKSYLSAVRSLHISYGLHQQFSTKLTPRLQMVLRRIKKGDAEKGPKTTRLPITPSILHMILAILQNDPSSWNSIMLWAAGMLAFLGFLRCNEFILLSTKAYDPDVHLSYSDIAVDSRGNPSMRQVHVKASCFGKGCIYT